ncbi:ABC transporter ATP-binding protein [Nocardia sp. NEAU-G5]|uniref:ABC transporter ATP-binding protein n=1 Tax=Nocardia albiluteola TaxID=2842303 RepID=A0ABS6B7P6_9NOCA|nr:ABC transporter ATP-binding protein [Nocardia albiluteola]MBU3066279.1 ABC transporter ATP-binding protein [Nocardia albiluteola]
MTDEPLVDVEGLAMSYGDRTVLRDVTFAVRRGEVLALLGPNGAGKSTTIEVLEGFRIRSGGRVRVLGVDPAHGGEDWRAGIGVVLQSWRDHGAWKVRELLAHLGSYYARYSDASYSRPWNAEELVAAVGLNEQAHTRIRRLSGGQRRRLDVAIGLVGRPELLFLDEPTTGFDPQARYEFHDLVRGLARTGRITIVLTTHDLAEAEKLADRIAILDDGRIVADGTPAQLAATIVGHDTVRWRCDGTSFEKSTPASTGFVHDLFSEHGRAITDLEVRRATLEDTYLALVRHAEDASLPEAS